MAQSTNIRFGTPSFKSIDAGSTTSDSMKLSLNGVTSFGLPFITSNNGIVSLDSNINLLTYDPTTNGELWIDNGVIKISSGKSNSNAQSIYVPDNTNYTISNKFNVIKSIGNNSTIVTPSKLSLGDFVVCNRTGVPITIQTNDGTTIENAQSNTIPTGTSVTFFFVGGDQWYTD